MRKALFMLLLLLAAGPGRAQSPRSLDTWFPILRVGMWVKVEGAMQDGALHASEVKIYAGELDEWEVGSNVVAVDVTQMTLQTEFGVTIQANERTDLQGPKGHPHIGFTFLSVGDRIETEGQWQKDGVFLAEEIELEKSKRQSPGMKYENEHEVTARIEAVDAQAHSVTLLGVPILFDENTRNKSLLLY